MENNSSKLLKFNIYIVRHGETDYNRFGIIQGQLNTKLSELGVEQAAKAGAYLKEIKFDYVFSSDLDRAFDTAKEIVNLNCQKSTLKLIPDKLLRERSFGSGEGKSVQILQAEARRKNKTLKDYIPPGGENNEQLQLRWRTFFTNLCKILIDENNSKNSDQEEEETKINEILIVSHGSFMRQIFKFFVFDLECDFPFCHSRINSKVPNTSVSKFSVELDLSMINLKNITCRETNKLISKCHSFHEKEHLTANLNRENLCSL